MLNHYHLCSIDEYSKRLGVHGLRVDHHFYCISQKALQLWDKMAILVFLGRACGKNVEEAIYNKYKSEIINLINTDSASDMEGANLLIISTKV